MSERIRGKVARILNSREIVITAGSVNGVAVGMYFDVIDPKGGDITDPDSGEVLGSIERLKVRVQVTHVKERLSVASTFRKQEINVGGRGVGIVGGLGNIGGLGAYARALMPPQYVTRYETLKKIDKIHFEDLDEEQSYVKTGDPVVQVVEQIDLKDDEDID